MSEVASAPVTGLDPARLARATTAVYVAFIGAGFGFATWAARIPQVRDSLGVNPAQLGLIILCVAIGSIISIPISGARSARTGRC